MADLHGFLARLVAEDFDEHVAGLVVRDAQGAEEGGQVELADALPPDRLAGQPGLRAAVVLVAGLVEVAGAVEGLAGGVDVAGGQVPLRAADGVGEEVTDRAQPRVPEVEVDQLRRGDGPGDAYTGVVRLRGLARFRGRRVDAKLQGGREVVGGRGERAGLHDGRARLGLLGHAVAPLTRNALGAGQLFTASLRLSAVSSWAASGNASRSENHQ